MASPEAANEACGPSVVGGLGILLEIWLIAFTDFG